MFSRLVCSNRVYRHHPPNRTLRPEHLHVYLFPSCYYLDHSALKPLLPWVSSHSLSSNCITIKHICVSASPQHQILVINICGGHNHYFVNIMDQFPCYYYHLKYSAQLPSLPPQFSDHHCESSDQFSIQWKHMCLVSTPQILAQPWQWLLDLADMLQVKLWNVSFFPEQDPEHTYSCLFPCKWVKFSGSHKISVVSDVCTKIPWWYWSQLWHPDPFKFQLPLCLFLVELPSVTYLIPEGWSWAAWLLQISVSGRGGYSHDGYRFTAMTGCCWPTTDSWLWHLFRGHTLYSFCSHPLHIQDTEWSHKPTVHISWCNYIHPHMQQPP